MAPAVAAVVLDQVLQVVQVVLVVAVQAVQAQAQALVRQVMDQVVAVAEVV